MILLKLFLLSHLKEQVEDGYERFQDVEAEPRVDEFEVQGDV